MTKYLPSRIIRHIDGNYRCLCWLYVCEQGAGHFCGLNGNIKKECLKIFLMEPTLCVTNLGAASVMNVTSVTRLWRFQWSWIIKCYEQISRLVIIIDALFFPDGHWQHDWVPHVRDPSPDNGSKLGEAELSLGLYCDNCDNTKAHSISCWYGWFQIKSQWLTLAVHWTVGRQHTRLRHVDTQQWPRADTRDTELRIGIVRQPQRISGNTGRLSQSKAGVKLRLVAQGLCH